MANTYVDYTAVAAQTDYNFSFEYLRDEHVKVKVNGVEVTNFTIVTSPTPTKIRFNTAPVANAAIKIYRDSRGDFSPLVDFVDGSILTENELDESYKHNLFIGQEASEGQGGEQLTKKGLEHYDAEGNKIINLFAPSDNTDAANKGYVDQTIDNAIALGGSPAIVSLGGYDVTATGSTTTRSLANRFADFVNVLDYLTTAEINAVRNNDYSSVTSVSASVQNAIDASTAVYFPKGTYRLDSSINITANNVHINLEGAEIVNSGCFACFDCGATSDTVVYSGLKIVGGLFNQLDPATTDDRNYIRVRGYQHYTIKDGIFNNISNGGIYIQHGTDHGLIDNVKVIGKTSSGTVRGIWLQGAGATGYASQYVDVSSFTRNATPFPTAAVKNLKICNSYIAVGTFGIYSDNSRNLIVENCFIEDLGGGRAITLNTYSPGARIVNNRIVGDATEIGILVTQASTDVVIEGNTINGSFAGGKAIYVQYLSHALISNNSFYADATGLIEINTGGSASIEGNYFERSVVTPDARCVLITPSDKDNVSTTPSMGDTATVLNGVTFKDNVLKNWLLGVLVHIKSSVENYGSNSGTNFPSFKNISVTGNTFLSYDATFSGTNEYPVTVLMDDPGPPSNITEVFLTDNRFCGAENTGTNSTRLKINDQHAGVNNGAVLSLTGFQPVHTKPANSTVNGSKHQFSTDGSYLYVHVGGSAAWRRVAISTF